MFNWLNLAGRHYFNSNVLQFEIITISAAPRILNYVKHVTGSVSQ